MLWVLDCPMVSRPLESTGLMTTHENILFFANALARRNGLLTDVDRKSFNFTVDKVLENMKLFVAQHYYLTQRQDNKYWRDVTNIELGHGEWRLGTEYSTLQSKQEYYNLLDKQQINSMMVTPLVVCCISQQVKVTDLYLRGTSK